MIKFMLEWRKKLRKNYFDNTRQWALTEKGIIHYEVKVNQKDM